MGAEGWRRPVHDQPDPQKALTDLGKIDAAGGIATKVLVPIPMVVSGTATVGDLVWGRDPEELRKINEQKLKETGVPADTIQALYLSNGFTLTLYTRLASSLRAVNVPGCADYASTAAEADVEREALFFTESAEMLERFHKSTPVEAILTDSRAVVAKAKNGKAIVLLPVDWVGWTEAYEKALVEVEKQARGELRATKLELRMTGSMSDVAKKEMTARGWTVAERLPGSSELAQAKAPAP